LKISQLLIENFRGIRTASLFFPDHAVLIGDNNVGKSTILEALDLVMGPDRLSRPAPIDEHDFHLGLYLAAENAILESTKEAEAPPQIVVTVLVTGLSEEQRVHFGDYVEWWDPSKQAL
jgi:putative ATP-dependent endonuclease of OLD family